MEDRPITTTPAHSPSPAAKDSHAYRFALAAAQLAADTRCEDVVLLDLRGRSPVTEFFIIATGTSARQMRTIADELQDLGKREHFHAWQVSGYETAKWILVDFVHVVAHVFDPDSRGFYDLELLWGDCPRIDWRAELGLPPDAYAPAGPADVSTQERFAEAAGEDIEEAREEDARLSGEPVESEEGDADVDEEAETEAPVVVELPDESTGSNSVEFVEIDPPDRRRQRGKAVFPTPIEEEEEESGALADKQVAKESRDEDEKERAEEAAADKDVEAVSPEDLPQERIEERPMGGVSASLSSTEIEGDDEDQQRGTHEFDDIEQDHRDEISPAYEAAAETTVVRKGTLQEAGVELSAESTAERPRRRRPLTRAQMAGPTKSAPGPVNIRKAKAGVVKAKARPMKKTKGAATAAKASKARGSKLRAVGPTKARPASKLTAAEKARRKATTRKAATKTRKPAKPAAKKKPASRKR